MKKGALKPAAYALASFAVLGPMISWTSRTLPPPSDPTPGRAQGPEAFAPADAVPQPPTDGVPHVFCNRTRLRVSFNGSGVAPVESTELYVDSIALAVSWDKRDMHRTDSVFHPGHERPSLGVCCRAQLRLPAG